MVYGIVRHPMYVGMIVLYAISPIVLGSWWAVIPALVIIPVIVARILDEEKELNEMLQLIALINMVNFSGNKGGENFSMALIFE